MRSEGVHLYHKNLERLITQQHLKKKFLRFNDNKKKTDNLYDRFYRMLRKLKTFNTCLQKKDLRKNLYF